MLLSVHFERFSVVLGCVDYPVLEAGSSGYQVKTCNLCFLIDDDDDVDDDDFVEPTRIVNAVRTSTLPSNPA